MSAAMDMYLSMTDSLSFQDMLDIDIKSEVDTLVGGHNDLSGFNFSDLPPLELDDCHDIKWLPSHSSLSNSSFNLDLSNDDASAMVNPNAVMPLVSLAQNIRSPSPSLKESHLTFSPSCIKISNMKNEAVSVKKDLLNKLEDVESKPIVKATATLTKITPVVTKTLVKTVTKPPTLLTFKNAVQRHLQSSPVAVAQINNIGTVRTIATIRKPINKAISEFTKPYPKPAYSYSCLIAMALKNSKSGSLPVSEIYNFMCRHFPYFKTAPNGWKNSVRHNLSLNKCFEKIEKPAINGTQRKGCLWAMNPSKISKMDEEVQKWSRKDPSAIKKAMVNPDTLEALERGEMKFSCSYDEGDNFGDSCGSAESEEGSDSDGENTNNSETEFIELPNIRRESEEELVEYDGESMYSGEMDVDDEQLLRVEVALAQKELLEFEESISRKKKRIYVLQD